MRSCYLIVMLILWESNIHAQSIDSLLIIKKNIFWLQNNRPNDEWKDLSTKTISWIISGKYNFIINADPIENVINEKDINRQYFAKIYFLSVFLYCIDNDVLKYEDASVLYGIKSMIKFYTISNEEDSTKYTNKALNFLMDLNCKNKLDDYIKRHSIKK